jgi:lactoylglutathione lyase
VGKLNLVVLRSADIEAARSFYECFDMGFQRHRHGQGPEHYAAEHDDIVFEIYPAAGQAEPDSAGLGFVVADLRATTARLCDAGYTPGEISTNAWGTTFVVRDSDGRRVEVQGEPAVD